MGNTGGEFGRLRRPHVLRTNERLADLGRMRRYDIPAPNAAARREGDRSSGCRLRRRPDRQRDRLAPQGDLDRRMGARLVHRVSRRHVARSALRRLGSGPGTQANDTARPATARGQELRSSRGGHHHAEIPRDRSQHLARKGARRVPTACTRGERTGAERRDADPMDERERRHWRSLDSEPFEACRLGSRTKGLSDPGGMVQVEAVRPIPSQLGGVRTHTALHRSTRGAAPPEPLWEVCRQRCCRNRHICGWQGRADQRHPAAAGVPQHHGRLPSCSLWRRVMLPSVQQGDLAYVVKGRVGCADLEVK
jgi:hypothetical protein